MFEWGRGGTWGLGLPEALTPGPARNRSGDFLSLSTARSLAASTLSIAAGLRHDRPARARRFAWRHHYPGRPS
jgi:hypothetical protein